MYLVNKDKKYLKYKTVEYANYEYKKYFKKYFLIKIILFLIIIILILMIDIIILEYKYNNLLKSSQNTQLSQQNEYLKMCYKSRSLYYLKSRGEILTKNISQLTTIQEKINYLLIHESPDYKSKIVDKIGLHEYSKKILGKDICVPIIKIYKSINDINLSELPNKFVLKCNHGSQMNIICNDKSKFNLNKSKFWLNKWINTDFGFKNSEFQYINVKRKIFAEKFLKDDIEDYKVYCFHGEPKFIRVQKKNKKGPGKINNYYDLNWNLTDIETGLPHFYRKPEVIFNKPINFDLMLNYSRKLSEEFVFVRVDFYNINGKIYLGELTFTPSNLHFKLKNLEQSIFIGNFIDLTRIKDYLIN
jgi:hypothetical protein